MSYSTYPGGYVYPNEYAEPIIWLPVLIVYTIFISIASGSAILSSYAIITMRKSLIKIIPLTLILAVSSSLIILLGPLADLRHPEKAYLIFTSSHIVPSSTTPGIALIALMANLWIFLAVFAILVMLLFLAPDIAEKAVNARSRFSKLIYKILSLGAKPGETKGIHLLLAKILSYPYMAIGIIWSTYYAGLLFTAVPIMYLYNLLPLLPVSFLIESLIITIFILLLALFVIYKRNIPNDVLMILTKIFFGSVAFYIIIISFEFFRLYYEFSGQPVVDVIINRFGAINLYVLLLMILALIMGIVSSFIRSIYSLALGSILSLIGILINRWSLIIDLQTISRTGLGYLEAGIIFEWRLIGNMIALPLFFVAIFTVISMIYPIGKKYQEV
jgi:predicted membrane protein